MEIQKTIVFNGRKYSLMGGKKKYYLSKSNTNQGRKNPKGLHVAIWEFHNKRKVAKGFVIHHKDNNIFNNNISNLELLSYKEHAKHRRFDNEKNKKHLANIRKLATEWHRSPEGREWHRQKAKKQWDNPKLHKLKCTICCSFFQSPVSTAKTCSQRCRDKKSRDKKKSLQFKS